MIAQKADEIVLETECHNRGALHLYEQLGFVRDKRLYRYYLNGVDAYRLKLWTGLRLSTNDHHHNDDKEHTQNKK
jgi:ribosomal protein S18 acetylase RimI-like enzyme